MGGEYYIAVPRPVWGRVERYRVANMPGGRPKGSKNKATLEREFRADQARARMLGPDKLAKDVIEYFMNKATAFALKYEPKEEDLNLEPPLANVTAKEVAKLDPIEWRLSKFKEWATVAVAWGKELAPYQSATYRAVQIAPIEDTKQIEGTVIRTIDDLRQQLLSLGIQPETFAQALIGKPPKLIEAEISKGRP
jgi:hypothetical protein